MSQTSQTAAQTTPLHGLHQELGARMVPFAGYLMPLQYTPGILAEHRHTRAEASLFDVSHMGQIALQGPQSASLLETLVPGDVTGLAPGAMRYTVFTNDSGGILDDLIVANAGDHLFVVVNAACKAGDLALLQDHMGQRCRVRELAGQALLALQGPAAEKVLARHARECRGLTFMRAAAMTVAGKDCFVSRSGYTGEDGFEISVAASEAMDLASTLLDEPQVRPAGLGARDSLRLEAGLCLYGHDIDATTTPVEAGLAWTIAKRRLARGGFPGASVIRRQLSQGPPRRRVGIRPQGPAPARQGARLLDPSGEAVGSVTSGGFGPTVGGPVAMGYVACEHAADDTVLQVVIRDVARPARVVSLPFVPTRYHKGDRGATGDAG